MNTAICIVCGNIIGWYDEPNPACLTHSYGQVIDAIKGMSRRRKAAQHVANDLAGMAELKRRVDAVLALEGIVFCSDDKKRPMLAQCVVRRILAGPAA